MKSQIQANVDAPAICNQLLESEAAAIDAYEKAITVFDPGSGISNVMENLRDRHLRTFKSVSSALRSGGTEPSIDPNGPQVLTYFAQQSSDSRDKDSTLATLLRGEKHGKHLYEEAIRQMESLANAQAHIIESVLPLIVENIVILRTVDEQDEI